MLYLIDLESTNGMLTNAVTITQGQARALRHGDGDTVTLGKLSFEIKIIDMQR